MHGDGSGDPGCNLDAKTLKAIKEADINFIMWCSRCLDWEEKMKKGFTVTCSDEEWESFKRSPFKGDMFILESCVAGFSKSIPPEDIFT